MHGPRVGQAGQVGGDRADADDRAHPVADPVQEVVGDAYGALLAVPAGAGQRAPGRR